MANRYYADYGRDARRSGYEPPKVDTKKILEEIDSRASDNWNEFSNYMQKLDKM